MVMRSCWAALVGLPYRVTVGIYVGERLYCGLGLKDRFLGYRWYAVGRTGFVTRLVATSALLD
jgi:hypothetical protein